MIVDKLYTFPDFKIETFGLKNMIEVKSFLYLRNKGGYKRFGRHT